MKTSINLSVLTGALLLPAIVIAQVSNDTSQRPRTNTRGDRNTEVITSSRQNVPANQRNRPVQSIYRPDSPGRDNPDVLLDVPNLSRDTLVIEVDSLYAHLALDARVANLV